MILHSLGLSKSCRSFRPGGVAFKGAGGRELPQLMAHHILGKITGNKLPPIVDRNGVPHHVRGDGRSPRPSSDHYLLIGLIHVHDLLEKMIINKWALFN